MWPVVSASHRYSFWRLLEVSLFTVRLRALHRLPSLPTGQPNHWSVTVTPSFIPRANPSGKGHPLLRKAM